MRFNRKKILVTDDGNNHLMQISILLNRMGFNVLPASDAEETVKLMEISQPDLVMLDTNLPGTSLSELIYRIRRNDKLAVIPLIVLTGRDASSLEKIEGTMPDVLTKPVDIDALHEVLQEYLFMPYGIRRRHLRSSYRGRVRIRHQGGQDELFARTISEGGIYIRKPVPLPVGAELEVTLLDADRELLRLRGTVIYISTVQGDAEGIPPGMAVEFSDMNDDQQRVLSAMVRKLLDV